MEEYGYGEHIALNERVLKLVFGATESLLSSDTYQFKDYAKVVATRFDPEKKAMRRKGVFPTDCEKAFDLGARLVAREL